MLQQNSKRCKCGAPLEPGRIRCKPCHAARMRQWRRENPAGPSPHDAARAVARKQKARGRIALKPCVVCGSEDAQMHHPDYERPQDVTWLCEKHHVAWHRFWRRLVIEKFEAWVAAQHRALAAGKSSPDDEIGASAIH